MRIVLIMMHACWDNFLHIVRFRSIFTFIYIYIYIHIYIKKKLKLVTIIEGNPKAPFSRATTPMCRGRRYSFPGLLYFTLDPYLIMLSVKQRGIKYHFLSLWYDSTWDWTQVSRAIGQCPVYIYIYIYIYIYLYIYNIYILIRESGIFIDIMSDLTIAMTRNWQLRSTTESASTPSTTDIYVPSPILSYIYW